MYTLKGAIKSIGDINQISDSFKKREFVVVDDSGQYEQTILFQAVQDRCEILDRFVEGSEVEVTFFLRGREWTNPKDGVVKVFNSLDAWKVEPLNKGQQEQPTAEQMGDDSDKDENPF
jgi:hypothetical protein